LLVINILVSLALLIHVIFIYIAHRMCTLPFNQISKNNTTQLNVNVPNMSMLVLVKQQVLIHAQYNRSSIRCLVISDVEVRKWTGISKYFCEYMTHRSVDA
jgi:hypothetical protein